MKTTRFVDLLLSLKKQLKWIALCALIGVMAALLIAQASQSYTATVGLKYSHEGAKAGLDPLGGKLDPYELMQPSLIATALKGMGSDLSVDEVRNQLSISPVVTASTEQAQQALLERGEVMTVHPDEYSISYTCPRGLGSQFAKRLLYHLLQAYDDHFSLKYLSMQRVPDFMTAVDIQGMDYMEIVDYVDGQIGTVLITLDALVEKDAAFTSLSTGLDFAALRNYYQNMRANEYESLYASVRMGLLAKDKGLLVKSLQKRIEDIRLLSENKRGEADTAYAMAQTFYEQYKKNDLYDPAPAAQAITAGQDSDNRNIVYDYDLSRVINTYDDILLRCVQASVDATDLKHDSAYYAQLIAEFEQDNVDPAEKRQMLAQTEATIARLADLSGKYATLANQTLADYYDYKVASDVKYVMSVEVRANVSLMRYMAVGLGVMLLFGCVLAIMIHVIKAQLSNKRMAGMAAGQGTVTHKMIEDMSVMERAFFEQAQAGFPEFYLMFQPIVDMDLKWAISETLVRWNSRRLGQVTPSEFLPIAEKFQMGDLLGEWVMKQACMQSLKWGEMPIQSSAISVNYSVKQIESQAFIDSICRILLETKVNAHKIYLEISGGGELTDVEQVAQKFIALKALGVRVAIDRFGESMSSMRALYELPADMVKVDKKYIAYLGDEGGSPFLKEILSVCKDRGLTLCMGGVEAQWQLDQLRILEVDYMQGFLFSSPLPLAAYEEKMLTHATEREQLATAIRAAGASWLREEGM